MAEFEYLTTATVPTLAAGPELVLDGNAVLAEIAAAEGFDPGSDPLEFALRVLRDHQADVAWTVQAGGPFGAVVTSAKYRD